MRKRDRCLVCGRVRNCPDQYARNNHSHWHRFTPDTPANRAKAEKPVDKKPVVNDNPLFPFLGPPE
jgi:hypothetical protein